MYIMCVNILLYRLYYIHIILYVYNIAYIKTKAMC